MSTKADPVLIAVGFVILLGAPDDQERGFQKLSVKEKEIWREAVAFYSAGLSKKDLVFDKSLPALTNALARAGESKSLSGVDPEIAAVLEHVGPIYRKAWWKSHHDANREWHQSTRLLVDKHGAAILSFITNAYQMKWPPEGYPIHVSAYSNWAGAYSTDGNLLVLSSLSSGLEALYGLETVFHEGMHQWDTQIQETLRKQAIKLNKRFPRNLSHSLIFFTAGEAVRRVSPSHVPYAERSGVWQRGMGQFKVALEKTWKPYLDGKGSRDKALVELIKLTAIESPQQ